MGWRPYMFAIFVGDRCVDANRLCELVFSWDFVVLESELCMSVLHKPVDMHCRYIQ